MTASEQGGFPLQLSLLLVCSGVIVAGGGSGLGQGYIFGFYVFLPLPVNPFLSLICLCLCLSLSLCVTDWGRGAKTKGVDGMTDIRAKSVPVSYTHLTLPTMAVV